MRIGYANTDSLLTYPHADKLSALAHPIRIAKTRSYRLMIDDRGTSGRVITAQVTNSACWLA